MTQQPQEVITGAIPPLIGENGVFRVVIHGNSGTGKSTVALQLGKILNVPVHHMDELFWRPNWVEAPTEELLADLQRIIDDSLHNNTGWVVDGNYESRTKCLMDSVATDILWLDPPFYKYFPSIILRTFRRLFGRQPTCAPGCYESWTETFFSSKSILWWAITNHRLTRNRYGPRCQSGNVSQGGRWRRLGGIPEYNLWLESVKKFVKHA